MPRGFPREGWRIGFTGGPWLRAFLVSLCSTATMDFSEPRGRLSVSLVFLGSRRGGTGL